MTEQTRLNKVVIDFLAKGEDENQWLVVLVEEASAEYDSDEFLYDFQDRLYNCLDAIIDGQLADKFPDTLNKDIVIRVDCYQVPRQEVEEFFDSFSTGVLAVPDYAEALANSSYVNNIAFEINFD